MAISTSGFDIPVQARYTPVDPNLVAFNPNEVTKGVLSAYQVAETQAKLKAYQALQQELDATRQSRIGAQNAKDVLGAATDTGALKNVDVLNQSVGQGALANIALAKKTIATAPGQAEAINAETANTVATLPGQTEATVAKQKFDASQRAAIESVQSFHNAALSSAAPTDYLTTLNTASTNLVTAKFQLAKIEDELKSLPEDKARKDALENAKIRLAGAEADFHESQVRYNDQRPTSAEKIAQIRAQGIDQGTKAYGVMAQDYAREANELSRLRSTAVTNPIDGSKIAASQLEDLIAMNNDSFFKKDKKVSPSDQKILDQITNKQRELDAFGQDIKTVREQVRGHILGTTPATAPSAPKDTYAPDPVTGQIVKLNK